MKFDRLKVLLDGMEYDGVSCLSPAQKFGSGAIEVETGLLLYALTRRHKPLCIVQTGTHWGYSTAWMAAAIEENHHDYPEPGKPRLYTWDSNDYDGKADTLLHQMACREYVELIVGDSRARGPEGNGKDASTLPPIDFLFLDADHGTDAVLEEWERFSPYLSPGALMLFHDTTLDPREAEGVRIIAERTGWPIIALRNCRGLDIMQKPA
jgi:predicted O-methyltransferase YrrM